MRIAAGILALILLIGAALYLTRGCQPGDPGIRIGGMVVAGCK